MADSAKSKTLDYWMLVSVAIPPSFFIHYGELFSSNEVNQVLIKVILGGLSAGFGYSVYYIIHTKSIKVKIIGLTLLFLFSIGPALLLRAKSDEKQSSQNYSTCPVCGYIAYQKSDSSCNNCLTELSQAKLAEFGASTVTELVEFEQLSFFANETFDSTSFYLPEYSEEGFYKDKNWRPLVQKDSVEAFLKKMKKIQTKITITTP